MGGVARIPLINGIYEAPTDIDFPRYLHDTHIFYGYMPPPRSGQILVVTGYWEGIRPKDTLESMKLKKKTNVRGIHPE